MHPAEVEMTTNVVRAIQQHPVDRFVYYSVMHPLRIDVRHHRLKLEAETLIVEAGIPYAIVEPIRYMQHLEMIWARVVESGIHAMPFSIEQRFSVVDLEDVAEATATVACEPGHDFATYELAGPQALSQIDMARIIGDVIGAPIRAERIDPATAAERARNAGASEDRAAQMRIMNEHYDRFGFPGNPNVLQWILGRPATTFERYVRRIAADFARETG